jgi:hypothetical protein
MLNVTYGSPVNETLGWLLPHFPDSDLRSLTRSTVPLLDYWRRPKARLEELCAALSLATTGHETLAFEFPVPNGEPRSNPSFTDLMILSTEWRVGIEAKWTEPKYETVSAWIDAGKKPDHRRRVLERWLRMIDRFAWRQLDTDAVSDVTYQMIHRLASVCDGAGEKAVLVYHRFTDDEHAGTDMAEDLGNLVKTIRPTSELRVYHRRTQMTPTAEFRRIEQEAEEWTIPELAAALRYGLMTRELFSFHDDKLERIRSK